MRGSAARIDRKAVDSPDIIVPSPGRAVHGESRFVRFRTRFVKNGGAPNGLCSLSVGFMAELYPLAALRPCLCILLGDILRGFIPFKKSLPRFLSPTGVQNRTLFHSPPSCRRFVHNFPFFIRGFYDILRDRYWHNTPGSARRGIRKVNVIHGTAEETVWHQLGEGAQGH